MTRRRITPRILAAVEFREILKRRRMVRAYGDAPIPRDVQQQAFRELLSIPDDVAVVACVTIGKPAADSNWSAVSSRLTQARKPLGELVRWE
jgi:nitroreductase